MDEKAKNDAIYSIDGATQKSAYVPIRNRSSSNTSRSLDPLTSPKSRTLYPSVPRKDVESSEKIVKPHNPFINEQNYEKEQNQDQISNQSDPVEVQEEQKITLK